MTSIHKIRLIQSYNFEMQTEYNNCVIPNIKLIADNKKYSMRPSTKILT